MICLEFSHELDNHRNIEERMYIVDVCQSDSSMVDNLLLQHLRSVVQALNMFGNSEVMDDDLHKNLEDDEVQEVLRTGTDLREYAQQIDSELKIAEQKSIQDYLKESENIASLHTQIESCDNILERMETMLLSFQVISLFK